MKITLGQLKLLIQETMGADTLEQGDLVDVDTPEGLIRVRVLRMVPNIKDASKNVESDGPGFLGRIEGGRRIKAEEVWFSLEQVVPGSKTKHYFPSAV